MRLYFYGLVMLWRKFVLRRSTGAVVYAFAEKMGVVYIKMAQILAMQNVGNLFTEDDRVRLSQICDHCRPISFRKIKRIVQHELSPQQLSLIQSIDPEPLGSASISQVHRAKLKDGREIVLKIKRRDITKHIEHDIRQLKRFIRRFGRFAALRNLIGSDKALTLWMEWIYSEIDFKHEQANLQQYRSFAHSVNDQVRGAKHIVTPQLHKELCTENIIAMEYISAPTINRIPLTDENKEKISRGLNDYISLSFWALLHSQTVVFHGDPHGGNVYLDQDDNIGFLDMGLVFAFSGEEAEYVRQLFLNAYAGRAANIVDKLIIQSEYTEYDRDQLIADIQVETEKFHKINVAQFFINMINVFTQYDIAPPEIFFKMAKAFLAIFGICTFVGNTMDVEKLLKRQIVEFYILRTQSDLKNLLKTNARSMLEVFQTTMKEGLVSGCTKAILVFNDAEQDLRATIENGRELLSLIHGASKR